MSYERTCGECYWEGHPCQEKHAQSGDVNCSEFIQRPATADELRKLVDEQAKALDESTRLVRHLKLVLRAASGAIDALDSTLAFAARDWSANRRDALIWGVVCGWDDDDDDFAAMDEVAEKYGWSNVAVERLRRYHRGIRALMEHRDGDEGIE